MAAFAAYCSVLSSRSKKTKEKLSGFFPSSRLLFFYSFIYTHPKYYQELPSYIRGRYNCSISTYHIFILPIPIHTPIQPTQNTFYICTLPRISCIPPCLVLTSAPPLSKIYGGRSNLPLIYCLPRRTITVVDQRKLIIS